MMHKFRWWLSELLARWSHAVEPPLDPDLRFDEMVKDYINSDEGMKEMMDNMEKHNALFRSLTSH